MKKTLVTLLALASTAMGADQAAVVEAAFSLTDFSTYKTTTISEGGWTVNNRNSNVEAGKSLQFTNDVLFLSYGGEGYDALHNNNVVFTFVLSGLSSATGLDALYTLHTHAPNNSGSNVIGMCLDSENPSALTGIAGGSQWGDNRNKDIAYPTTGSFVLTVAHTTNGTKVYVDGTLQATISGLQYTGGEHTIKQLNFGNTSAGNAGVNVTLEGLYIHNQALTDAQVGDFVQSLAVVPEPTTATLSLLALAGLAVRRRRR